MAALPQGNSRDSRAAEGQMAAWNVYTGPHAPGYTEQVYLMDLYADDAGMTDALLKSADGTKGALVSFNIRELPFMTLWKNEAPAKSGTVAYPYGEERPWDCLKVIPR